MIQKQLLDLKDSVIRGLKLTFPLLLTILLIVWILATIESVFSYLIKPLIPQQYYFTGLGAIIGVFLVFLLGLSINAWIVRKFYKKGEQFISRIPLVKTIYQTFQDLLDMFDSNKQKMGTPVVLEFQGVKVIGFITKKTCEELNTPECFSNEIIVYIPLSYQIGGLSIMIDPKKVTPLNMSVQDAMKYILTAGVVSSHTNQSQSKESDKSPKSRKKSE